MVSFFPVLLSHEVVIRAGLAEVKIDELNEKLIVSRSTHTEFGAQQWQELQVICVFVSVYIVNALMDVCFITFRV